MTTKRPSDQAKTGRNARLRARNVKAEMTAEELEAERAELLAALDSDASLTEDVKARFAALAAADTRATTDEEYGMAVRELLTEALAVLPPTGATGITVHDRGGDILEFTLGEQTVLMVDRPTIAVRAGAIRRRRAIGRQ